ncbi:hypothetical protein CC1G_12219 [Coprinopsis cinerea okayama7|uniref:Probable velvet family sexual development regulator CC1G_12219 n=1 Tax=Coprinopsis cinerea (strain Okayama-7 / 130 / ATCC MYA-4618 / FGSC 9003) TaxID=240176 RepID=VEL_COPC7|nr:hypothetical protein CC1G_12219 [Coprinopsis cinerea okayama7\|eukprot:XP_001831699.2 hypothetical protein CC1G_12219 [Coprinopsis cinerea okayama7\
MSNTDAQTSFASLVVGPPVTDPINPLMGATSISPNLIELHGRKALVFAFGNLAVRAEGDFVLRYRVADILAGTGIDGVFPIQAICYGGPFHVFSTKDFPGYEASTELTKTLSVWGAQVNVREHRRRRRGKKDAAPAVTKPLYTTAPLDRDIVADSERRRRRRAGY